MSPEPSSQYPPQPVPPTRGPMLPGGASFSSASAAPPPSGDPPEGRSAASAVVAILVGLILFLAALIGVVLGARHLRPALATWSAGQRGKDLVQKIAQLKRPTSPEAAGRTAQAIAALGPEAVRRALDASLDVSETDQAIAVHKPAIAALAQIGPSIMHMLRDALDSGNLDERLAALHVLRQMGRDAEPAVTDLARLVGDENRWVRICACEALGSVGPQAAPAADALLAAVQQGDLGTRRRAIAALGQIGPAARAAVPVLIQTQDKDGDAALRQSAAAALYQIQLDVIAQQAETKAGEGVRALLAKVRSADQYEAVPAIKALAAKGAEARPAVPALALALADQNKWIREAAANALAALGTDAKPVLPHLRRLLEDPEPEVQEAAEQAVKKIEAMNDER